MGIYVRLVDYNSQQAKEDAFLSGSNRYVADSSNFTIIPGMPLAYWVSKKVVDLFVSKKVGEFCSQKVRICTGNNERFLRLWFEVNTCNMFYPKKWVLYNKGGKFNKWYGNLDYLLNYENNGFELKRFEGYCRSDENYFFRQGLTLTDLSTGYVSFRYLPVGTISDASGPMLYVENEINILYLLGMLNSVVSQTYVGFLCPSLHFKWGEIAKIPFISSEQNRLTVNVFVEENINLAKSDWDSYETSWNFKKHPLI